MCPIKTKKTNSNVKEDGIKTIKTNKKSGYVIGEKQSKIGMMHINQNRYAKNAE